MSNFQLYNYFDELISIRVAKIIYNYVKCFRISTISTKIKTVSRFNLNFLVICAEAIYSSIKMASLNGVYYQKPTAFYNLNVCYNIKFITIEAYIIHF